MVVSIKRRREDDLCNELDILKFQIVPGAYHSSSSYTQYSPPPNKPHNSRTYCYCLQAGRISVTLTVQTKADFNLRAHSSVRLRFSNVPTRFKTLIDQGKTSCAWKSTRYFNSRDDSIGSTSGMSEERIKFELSAYRRCNNHEQGSIRAVEELCMSGDCDQIFCDDATDTTRTFCATILGHGE